MLKRFGFIFSSAVLTAFLAFVFVIHHERATMEGKFNSYGGHSEVVYFGQPVLRVVMPYEKRLLRASTPFGPGMEEELLAQFLEENGLRARVRYVRAYQDALDLLRDNRCDLVVGFGGTLQEEQRANLEEGPVYASFYPVLVSAPGDAERIYSNVLRCGLKNPFVAERGGIIPASAEGKNSFYLLNPHIYSILVPMLKDDMQTKGTLKESVGYRWFWRADNAMLKKRMGEFWNDKKMAPRLAELRERYFDFMPAKADPLDLLDLSRAISEKMSRYSDAIARAAEETGVDPLLIAAVIFQESRFEPGAISGTGVRGIMQLTTGTANMLKVNRLNPEECILGGARYLRDLNDSLKDLDMPVWERWCFALAAYNQGPGFLRGAIRQVESRGLPLNWGNLRQVYRSMPASDGQRPREAVHHVESVRYYYYVMSRLAAVAAGGEDQDLSPLLLLTAASS